ncbi:serine-rich and transmembrane domain-containing 2-like [Scyliorhinus canicula]|uniref:serine-rich and transmembrane domain-containing 2-like n=1 Tax=Scyliorhinus canicula TaxID=7830 RepID=UPI0018F5B939|nr:serine-rich and transmembrane domain-containing 2-like [Scyliorhinus canicula]
MTEFDFRQAGNFTAVVFHQPTMSPDVEDSVGKPSNIYTYVAIFISLLVLLLVIMVTVLYRLKHVIAPVSSPVESAGNADIFTNVEAGSF